MVCTGKDMRRHLPLISSKVAENPLILFGSLKVRCMFSLIEVTLMSLDY